MSNLSQMIEDYNELVRMDSGGAERVAQDIRTACYRQMEKAVIDRLKSRGLSTDQELYAVSALIYIFKHGRTTITTLAYRGVVWPDDYETASYIVETINEARHEVTPYLSLVA